MKTLFLAVILCASINSSFAETPKPQDWVTPSARIPQDVTQESNKISDDRFYECKITRLGTAIQDLKGTSFVELDDKMAAYFAGHAYRSRKGHKAYLVRAVTTFALVLTVCSAVRIEYFVD